VSAASGRGCVPPRDGPPTAVTPGRGYIDDDSPAGVGPPADPDAHRLRLRTAAPCCEQARSDSTPPVLLSETRRRGPVGVVLPTTWVAVDPCHTVDYNYVTCFDTTRVSEYLRRCSRQHDSEPSLGVSASVFTPGPRLRPLSHVVGTRRMASALVSTTHKHERTQPVERTSGVPSTRHYCHNANRRVVTYTGRRGRT
jgi:hypothetical protein